MQTELNKKGRLAEIMAQAEGLADLYCLIGECTGTIEPATLSNTAWLLRDMMKEAQVLLNGGQ